jgi:hypothetical protein
VCWSAMCGMNKESLKGKEFQSSHWNDSVSLRQNLRGITKWNDCEMEKLRELETVFELDSSGQVQRVTDR